MSDLSASLAAAASGLKAQTVRIRVAAENIANANSTADAPGGEPYRRRVPVFEPSVDRDTNALVVRTQAPQLDRSAFQLRYEPGHPVADENGYVQYPNVVSLIEAADLRDASRAYEANLTVIENARALLGATLGILQRT
ncbi:MAG TPA: flagellar basal body rod protein FlgC [Hyphomonadaceae bacterium]|nr:flagellar basal body rod protein FlgC [Hyphomonadaceae bacterium]